MGIIEISENMITGESFFCKVVGEVALPIREAYAQRMHVLTSLP